MNFKLIRLTPLLLNLFILPELLFGEVYTVKT